ISRVMIKVSAAVDEGGEDLQSFATAAGMSAEAFSDQWRTAPVDALMSVVGGLARMTEEGEGTFAMLDELGLRDVRVTNAMLSLSNAVDLTSDAVAMSSDEWDRNTALVEEAAKRYETTEAQLAMARNSINDAAITLGEVFLPAIADAASGVADLAERFGNLPPQAHATIGALGAVAGGAALTAGSFLLIFPRVMDTVSAFRELEKISPRLSGGLRGVGRAAGIAGGAAAGFIALTAAVEAFATRNSATSVEETTRALLEMKDVSTDLDSLFQVGLGVDQVNGLTDAIDRLVNPTMIDRVQDFGGSVRGI